MTTRMPVLFVGHGSPLYAILESQWSQAFRRLAAFAPKPRAVLMISAHWFTDRTLLTGNAQPRTIHDFYGFPQELHEVQYAAPGDPALAARIRELIGKEHAQLTDDWGLDHGSWSILRWMYPAADVPVIQLSINGRLDNQGHFEVARRLAPLRDEGVLIVGSGNVTHNLRDLMMRMQSGDSTIPDWARNFDERLKDILLRRDTPALLALWPSEGDARRAHPTPDHFLPVVYAYAPTGDQDEVSFPIEGFDHSASMRAVLFAPAN